MHGTPRGPAPRTPGGSSCAVPFAGSAPQEWRCVSSVTTARDARDPFALGATTPDETVVRFEVDPVPTVLGPRAQHIGECGMARDPRIRDLQEYWENQARGHMTE